MRRLRNVVEQCVALSTTPVIPVDQVRDALQQRQQLPTLDDVRADAERAYLVQVLRLTRGNVSRAARLAGRNRTEFYKVLGRYRIDPDRYREG